MAVFAVQGRKGVAVIYSDDSTMQMSFLEEMAVVCCSLSVCFMEDLTPLFE